MAGPAPTTQEGTDAVQGYRLYWRSIGSPAARGTVLTVHGGPGMTHDYLRAFDDLARHGYRVVYYDQLGCGRSELARDPSEYTIDRDVEDLDLLRRHLGLGAVHLVGSSYGGLLAVAYTLAHPEGVRTLVSASGLADVPLAVEEMQRLVRELPTSAREAIERYGAKAEFQHPAYLEAVQEFYRRHLCRLDPWPAELTYTMEHVSPAKYGTMNGPNEFTIIGTISDWSVTDRLSEIRAPTLLTTGRFDEVTPRVAESMHAGIRGSELRLFERSSHTAFWEERADYMAAVVGFLGRHP
jgi:proline iminopeptidase